MKIEKTAVVEVLNEIDEAVHSLDYAIKAFKKCKIQLEEMASYIDKYEVNTLTKEELEKIRIASTRIKSTFASYREFAKSEGGLDDRD